ncbi:Hypothetical protein YggS, proline synthase co-transcribed bacterial homolog PROSC [hydrothermal vent metagenome]|uniref:Alanine racemase N-terminal domain-containing protein n=1 Tax=hydrothermal vent metagenome TaxID=652676 RepID=A0A3B1EAA9_9ZZZZ
MTNMSNMDRIFQNIETARISISEYHIVKIVAISKYVQDIDIKNLYEQGQRAFGESKVQDLSHKVETLDELPLEWHFIGTLQKNKINHLLKLKPFLFQSLDSLSLASSLDDRLKKNNQKISALLQINSSNEDSKSGVELDKAIDIYQEIQEKYTNIDMQGVMCIGAFSDEKKDIQKSFEGTYKIFEHLKNNNAKICSMGMSNDYQLAIKCGSNMVRIGRAFFE